MTDRTCATTFLVALLVALAGCGGGDRNVVEPPLPAPTDFTLTMRAHPEDLAVARELGWAGGIPNLEVRIEPMAGGGPAQVVTTGADGAVRMDALEPGSYRILATRMLTEAERSRLGSGSDVVAFVGGDSIGVGAHTSTATVGLPASRRRSLVISEWSFNSWQSPTSDSYLFGGYLELYNNSDTTVYLDGVLIGNGYDISTELPYLSCASSAMFWNDPAGAWVLGLNAFPGSGRQYPLAPGGVVVVATDAIDHSALIPDMLDLRGADFEFIGPADVDNPAVPNMIDVGTFSGHFGHGMSFEGSLSAVAVLGAATDPASLPRKARDANSRVLQRIARDGVLDVMATSNTYLLTTQPPQIFCDAMIHLSLDRNHGFFLRDDPDEYRVSISRKVLATLPDGRPLLQHTRTSANDYHRTPRTPGVVK